jgi:solute carrier family 13 (sodium-dependent dicarboxylate transporter), member 2/3/5
MVRAAFPFGVLMSITLYWVLMKLMPPEIDEVPGGDETIRREKAQLGPQDAPGKETAWALAGIAVLLVDRRRRSLFDTASTTLVAITLMLLPGIGVMDWKETVNKIPWGTVLLFSVGIGLGSAILSTKAAAWLANVIVTTTGLQTMPALMILAILAAVLITIHLDFASAIALAAAMIPLVISVLQTVQTSGINIIGMTMVLQFVVSFGFILPVNAPQNMIAYGTETFTVRDFVRTGVR